MGVEASGLFFVPVLILQAAIQGSLAFDICLRRQLLELSDVRGVKRRRGIRGDVRMYARSKKYRRVYKFIHMYT